MTIEEIDKQLAELQAKREELLISPWSQDNDGPLLHLDTELALAWDSNCYFYPGRKCSMLGVSLEMLEEFCARTRAFREGK